MTLRGVQTAKKAKAKAKERASKGGRFNRRIQARTDEPFVGRFRGLTEPPDRTWTESELKRLDSDDLLEVCSDLQAVFHEDMEHDDLVQAVLDRYKTEPAINARHYCDRNKGRKGAFTFINCGDSEAAVIGDIRVKTDCKVCQARLEGDKGIGWPQTTNWFSFYDYRVVHRIPSSNDDKDEYVPCTMEDKGHCRHCSRNAKILEREGIADEDDILAMEKEDREEWCASTGYAMRYRNGMRMFNLASKFADLVFDLAARVSKICRSCGTGKITTPSFACPHCGEEYDLDDLIEAGWNPDDPATVECPECGEEGEPEPMYECSNCDDAKPGRLCDADVRCVMTGEGTSKNWTFTEQLPLRPLDYTDSDDAKVLREPLPDFESELAPPSEEDQLKFIGAPMRSPSVGAAPMPGVKAGKKGLKKGLFKKQA